METHREKKTLSDMEKVYQNMGILKVHTFFVENYVNYRLISTEKYMYPSVDYFCQVTLCIELSIYSQYKYSVLFLSFSKEDIL